MEVDRCYTSPTGPAALPDYAPLPSRAVSQVIAVQVSVNESARNADDDWWRLPATQFRLITDANDSYYPVAFQAPGSPVPPPDEERNKRERRWKMEELPPADVIYMAGWTKDGGPEWLGVTWLYRIPQDQTPVEMVFRGVARSDVPEPERGFPSAQVRFR